MMNFKSILTVFGIVVLIAPFATGQQRKFKQGVSGVITSAISQNVSNYSCSTQTAKPVVREIAIYEPLKFSNLKHCDYANPNCSPDLWDGVNGRLIKTIKSDDKGFFRVSLPEGKYSLIIKKDNGYYVPGNYVKPRNETDVLLIEVVKGKISEINLEINCSIREKLYRLGKAIESEIGGVRATKVSQCKFIAFGAKPCGGPWRYLFYSTAQTNENNLIKLVGEYNILDKKHNEERQVGSDCSYVSEPSDIYLKDGICKFR